MRKRLVAALLTAALAAGSMFAGTLTASAEEAEEKVLHIGWNADMQTMDVHKTTSNYAIPLAVFDRLFEVQLNDERAAALLCKCIADPCTDRGFSGTALSGRNCYRF